MSKYGFARNIETEVETAEEREHTTYVYRQPTLKEYCDAKKAQVKAWAQQHPKTTKALIIVGGALAFVKATTSVATKAAAKAIDGMEVVVKVKGDNGPSGTVKK